MIDLLRTDIYVIFLCSSISSYENKFVRKITHFSKQMKSARVSNAANPGTLHLFTL